MTPWCAVPCCAVLYRAVLSHAALLMCHMDHAGKPCLDFTWADDSLWTMISCDVHTPYIAMMPVAVPIATPCGNVLLCCAMQMEETDKNLIMTVKPRFVPPGFPRYVETYDKTNQTEPNWALRRDLKAGRSYGKIYMTADGTLVFRWVVVSSCLHGHGWRRWSNSYALQQQHVTDDGGCQACFERQIGIARSLCVCARVCISLSLCVCLCLCVPPTPSPSVCRYPRPCLVKCQRVAICAVRQGVDAPRIQQRLDTTGTAPRPPPTLFF